MEVIVTEKRCSKCLKTKPLADFWIQRGRASSWCRICHSEKGKSWNRKNRERTRKNYERWASENKERLREYRKEYRKEYGKDAVRDWRRRHPEKVSQYNNNRRAQKKRSKGVVAASEWKALVDKYDHLCLCCKKDHVVLTMDHIIPLSKGGLHLIDNIQPLCKSCNSRKHTQIIDYRR